MDKKTCKLNIKALCTAAAVGMSSPLFSCSGIAAALTAGAFTAICIEPIAAYAADYRIGAADWEYEESGRVRAIWDEANDKTTYTLDVYRGSVSERNKLYKNTIKTNGAAHDFGKTISKFGTGTYYYTVYPTKGGSSMKITSGALEVDSDMLSAIRKYINYDSSAGKKTYTNSKVAINLDTPLGWTMLPDGTWKYRITKTSFAKNQWLRVNGKWYYFGADSVMLTGWQNIAGKYFYFNKSGDLWTGGASQQTSGSSNVTTLPSSVQTAERTVTTDNDSHVYTGKTQQLTSLSVTFKEDEAEPNKVRPMTIIVPSGCEIVSTSYSTEPANWTPGTKVNILITVKAKDGYQFGNGMKVYGSNASFKSQSGDAFTRSLRFEYVAKTRLGKPQRVYLDGGSVVKWSKVSGASRYNVKISYDEEYTYNPESGSSDMTIYIDEGDDEIRYNGRNKSFTVSDTQIDAADYIGIDEIKDVKFYITAAAASSRSSYYLNSESVEFTAAQGQVESSTNTGSVTSNKNGDMVFIDSGGSYITGWQDIDGAWYYFENKGNAFGPGWKQIERRWYYFGEDHKMRVGWIQLGAYWYYLNEGPNDTYGAMLTGAQTINGTSYYLNDNASNGIPLGAWVQ